jgi:hypothetical protein
MLALFLNHPPLFVAGEIALSLSLALFVAALIAAVIRGAPRISPLRESGHPDATIVGRSLGEAVYARPNVPRLALATRPPVRQPAIRVAPRKRQLLRQRGPDTEPWPNDPRGETTELANKTFDSSRE